LLAPGDLTHFTLPIAPLLDTRRAEFIEAARRALADTLGAAHDAVLFTAREHVAGATDEEGLAIGRAVSAALVEILARLTETTRPGFLIAKGGITSHDLAAHGLGAHRIEVLGQLLPGVPLWRMGQETRLPGLLYVVFPGNVGGADALREGYEVLHGH
ncbi:MAG: nucleotide-binding domain containing protein, partial [Thermomicrobiales bacterium]